MLLIVLKNRFFKLMINSVYGKTMEHLRKRINVRPVNNEKDFLKYTSRPTHITHKGFDKNYAAIHEMKPVLTLNKPIYVGFTVLELSKCLMYDFHYIFIKQNLLWPLYHFVLTAFLYGFSSFDVLTFFPAYFNLLFHVFLLLIRFHSVSNFLPIILTPLAPAN